MWGPSVFLWITFGTILAGGVHDLASGFMSMRHEGLSVPELTGMYMGKTMKQVMRVFSTVLLFMVGVVFAVGPAGLLSYLCQKGGGGRDPCQQIFLAYSHLHLLLHCNLPFCRQDHR